MNEQSWVLVLEPDEVARQLIRDEMSKCRKCPVDVVFIETPEQLASTIAQRQVLPAMLLVEWFPNDTIVWPSLVKLDDYGILARTVLVAMTAKNGRQALTEAQRLGAKRFISKLPDNIAFRGKLSDVFTEFASHFNPLSLALGLRAKASA